MTLQGLKKEGKVEKGRVLSTGMVSNKRFKTILQAEQQKIHVDFKEHKERVEFNIKDLVSEAYGKVFERDDQKEITPFRWKDETIKIKATEETTKEVMDELKKVIKNE